MGGDSDYFHEKPSPWGNSADTPLPPAIDTHGGTGIPALDKTPIYSDTSTYQFPSGNSAVDKILGGFSINDNKSRTGDKQNAAQGKESEKLGDMLSKIAGVFSKVAPPNAVDKIPGLMQSSTEPFGKMLSKVRTDLGRDGERLELDLKHELVLPDTADGNTLKVSSSMGFDACRVGPTVSLKNITGLSLNGPNVYGEIQSGRMIEDRDGGMRFFANVLTREGTKRIVPFELPSPVVVAYKANL